MTASAAGASATGRPSAAGRLAAPLVRIVPPLVVFVLVLVAWEALTAGPGRRVIPAPTVIAGSIGTEQALLWRSAQATLVEALGGLLIGTVLGVAIGFATARWATARDVLLPIAIGASTIPLIAIAPIINNWFGVLNPLSKMMMAALLVFFPVVINVTRGLVQVQPAAIELMRSYAASPSEVLIKVRIPNMLPFFFTALKVATTLAFIGAIVGEYFGGTSDVLGRVVLQSMSNGKFAVAWAAILIGALGAMLTYAIVVVVERIAIPWYAALRGGEA